MQQIPLRKLPKKWLIALDRIKAIKEETEKKAEEATENVNDAMN